MIHVIIQILIYVLLQFYDFFRELIGHLHDEDILLLRPESFSFFLSYSSEFSMTKASLVCTKEQPLKDSGRISKMTSSCKLPITVLEPPI